MKEKFLKDLNRELLSLNKNERSRHLKNYQKIIEDKIDAGNTETNVISAFADIKLIANDILNSYSPIQALSKNIRYINKIFILFDIIVLFISYMLSYTIYFTRNQLIADVNFPAITAAHFAPFSLYAIALLWVIPVYLIIYFLFKLYTLHHIRQLHLEIRNIIFANIIGFATFTFILFLFQVSVFSRLFVIVFALINLVFEIIMRSILLKS